MNLQEVFNKLVMEATTIQLTMQNAATYNARRVSLLRKFKNYQSASAGLGLPIDQDAYIKCTWDAATNTATFCLAYKSDQKAWDGSPASPPLNATDL
jgi:hypothetical protein